MDKFNSTKNNMSMHGMNTVKWKSLFQQQKTKNVYARWCVQTLFAINPESKNKLLKMAGLLTYSRY